MTSLSFFPQDLLETIDSELVNEIIDDEIAENIKNKAFDEMTKVPQQLFSILQEPLEKFKSDLDSFVNKLHEITTDSFFDDMEDQYGSTLTSNYTFAMKFILSIVKQNIVIMPRQFSQLDRRLSEMNSGKNDDLYATIIDHYKQLLDELKQYITPGQNLPDILEIDASPNIVAIVDAFNVFVLSMLCIIIASSVKLRLRLKKDQIGILEMLLRDWTQEIMAQQRLLAQKQPISNIDVKLDIKLRRAFSVEDID